MDYFYQTLGLSDNQDGHQNGRHLSVYTFDHSNLVIYHQLGHLSHNFFQISYMDYFHQTIVHV